MSKTVLAQVDGFTPVIDALLKEHGHLTALIFGKVWRYCQMSDGVCKASQQRIADELGVTRVTVNNHFSILVENGYLEDITPDLDGYPHTYKDTGRANLSIRLTGGVNEIDRGCKSNLQGGVNEIDTKKVLKKEEDIKPKEEEVTAAAFKFYADNVALITSFSKDEIGDMIDTYNAHWFIEACKDAILYNKRSLKYIEGVLKGWKASGFRVDTRAAKQSSASKSSKLSTEEFDKIAKELIQEYDNV